MPHVMALDQGTTSSRSLIVRDDGELVAAAQREFEQIFPRPGWVEHNPADIWASQAGVMTEALSRAGLAPTDIAAVGITNQRETAIVWERGTGRPVHNAIVWQDRRTAPLCESLKRRGLEPFFQSRTGLVLDAYFSGSKIAWLLENVPGLRARAASGELAFGTVDTWLAWKLSAGALHITDPSNASRTLLYNIHTHQWDDDLLAALDIPRGLLPTVVPSAGPYGRIAPDLPLAGVPIASMIGDQQSATMGQACVEAGQAKNTYGTGCFLLMNTGDAAKPSANNLITTVAWQLPASPAGERSTDGDGRDASPPSPRPAIYALEGSVFVSGAIVQWLRDGLKIIRAAPDIERLAASVPDAGGVVLVPALAGLGAPHWDPDARGAIFGLTRGTTDAHVARAALDGIAFEVADLVDAMQRDAGTPMTELRVDGGAAANDLLMQIQADVLGIPVVRPQNLETTALGAASLAAFAVGLTDTPHALAAGRGRTTTFEPTLPAARVAALRERWSSAVSRTRAWAIPDETTPNDR